jgi:hypothetical protein
VSTNMFEEMKGVQLKKIEKREPVIQAKKPADKITKDETNFLKASLAAALQARRNDITRNQKDSDNSDNDDWSD